MALQASRPRILIADDVGLGKTIEAGILVSDLIVRGRGKRILKRILMVTSKAMLTQFQKEFWVRFSIGLTCLDSVVQQRIKERMPERHNPFHCFDRAIISIDTLKNNQRFGVAIENADRDTIVIDEAQNVAERRHGSGISYRARLAQSLTNRSDTLLLLSATPHDGSYRSFTNLIHMLSPLAITDQDQYGPEDIKGGLVRHAVREERECLPLRLASSPCTHRASWSGTHFLMRYRSVPVPEVQGKVPTDNVRGMASFRNESRIGLYCGILAPNQAFKLQGDLHGFLICPGPTARSSGRRYAGTTARTQSDVPSAS